LLDSGRRDQDMYYVNGRYLRKEEAALSVLDLGILRGFGVFEYLRTYRGRPFHLEEHLLRLRYSAEQLGLTLPASFEELRAIIETLQKHNQLTEASFKLIVTGGISEDQFTPQNKPSLIVIAYPLKAYPKECFTQGIGVVTTPLTRSFPAVKTTHYAPAIVALEQGKALGAKEALYVNAKGELLEATTSNFFAFKGGKLYTCDSEEILFGVTREVVLRLAQKEYDIERTPLRISEISECEEAFITASNKEIMPVVRIDTTRIGTGVVGPHTQRLMDQFRNYTEQLHWPFLPIGRHTLLEFSLDNSSGL
jgi:branched-chain amino acid aminotransferase